MYKWLVTKGYDHVDMVPVAKLSQVHLTVKAEIAALEI
jgi:hypothetical protein